MKNMNINKLIKKNKNQKKEDVISINMSLDDLWAKLNEKGEPTQNIWTHSSLTGYAFKYIIENIINPFLRDESKIDLSILPYSVLHDYGKMHMSFLCKSFKWVDSIIQRYNLSEKEASLIKSAFSITQINERDYTKTDSKYHHTVVGTNLLFQEIILSTKDMDENTVKTLADMLHLHHGKIIGNYSKNYCLDNLFIDLSKIRKDFLDKVEKEFGKIQKCFNINFSLEQKYVIVGALIFSDWVASSIDYACNNLSKEDMIDIINKKMYDINLIPTYTFLNKELSFFDIFGFEMNGLQNCINSIEISKNDKGSVFFIEDKTGAGKTEAALLLIYNILKLNMANGFYYSLPTQITSNNIYERLNNFISKIYKDFSGSNKIKLIHSMSFFMKENEIFMKHSKNRFYNKNKVSLCYPFGVGTIDQMLLSNLNIIHSDMRFYGLSNKIIVIDELHSYSVFTSTLLKELIKKLRELGCIIIIMSATLSTEAKEELLDVKLKGTIEYPSILKFSF